MGIVAARSSLANPEAAIATTGKAKTLREMNDARHIARVNFFNTADPLRWVTRATYVRTVYIVRSTQFEVNTKAKVQPL